MYITFKKHYFQCLVVTFSNIQWSPHLNTASPAVLPLQRARAGSRARSGGGATSIRCKPLSSIEKPGGRENGSPFRGRGRNKTSVQIHNECQKYRKQCQHPQGCIHKTTCKLFTLFYFPARKHAANWKASSCIPICCRHNFAYSQGNGQK